MIKRLMILIFLAITALNAAGCAVGCYVEDDDDDYYVDTYLEFYDDGTYVYFPGGDLDTAYQDLICGWTYPSGAFDNLAIDAYRYYDNSEYFEFDLYGGAGGLLPGYYYFLSGEVEIAYTIGPDIYYLYDGYVRLTEIDAIGGAIEGEFQGFFTLTPAVPLLDLDITGGYFRALMIEQP